MNNIDHISHDILMIFNVLTVISQKHYMSVSLKYIHSNYYLIRKTRLINTFIVIDNHCVILCSLSNQEKQNRANLPVAVVVISSIRTC